MINVDSEGLWVCWSIDGYQTNRALLRPTAGNIQWRARCRGPQAHAAAKEPDDVPAGTAGLVAPTHVLGKELDTIKPVVLARLYRLIPDSGHEHSRVTARPTSGGPQPG